MAKYLVCVSDERHASYEIERAILEKAGASSATISRVNRSLIYGNGGYESVLEKMKEKEGK